jgi:hypothetical protein
MRGLKANFPPVGSKERAWAQAIGFLRVDGRIIDDVVTTCARRLRKRNSADYRLVWSRIRRSI